MQCVLAHLRRPVVIQRDEQLNPRVDAVRGEVGHPQCPVVFFNNLPVGHLAQVVPMPMRLYFVPDNEAFGQAVFPPRVGVTVSKKLDRPTIHPHAFFGGEVECANVKWRLGQVGVGVHQRAPAARARDAIVNNQRVHNAGIGQAFQLRVDMFYVARMKVHRLAVNLSGETAGVGAPVHQLIESDI